MPHPQPRKLIPYAGFDPTDDWSRRSQKKYDPAKLRHRPDLNDDVLRALEAEGVLRIDIAARFDTSATTITRRLGLKKYQRPREEPAWWAKAREMAATTDKAEIARRLGVSRTGVRYALDRLANSPVRQAAAPTATDAVSGIADTTPALASDRARWDRDRRVG